jgi:carbamoyl-phosphate synthase large subunit
MGMGGHSTGPLTLLFTCAGRRVELLQAFRAAGQRLGVSLRLIAVDSDPTAPALYAADVPLIVPSADHADYIPALRARVKAEHVAALIPTTDTDLVTLAAHREEFAAAGCAALIGPPEVIRLCRDKTATYAFLVEHGIDTPRTWTPAEIRVEGRPPYPLFLKPRTGSASHSVQKLEGPRDLAYYLDRVPDAIVQEFVAGSEHTLDVYVGSSGAVRCVVPRQRWQVRGGEVSKGITVKNPAIMAAGRRVVEALGPGVRGVVTLQCVVTPDRHIRFIEINPRFGGGAPLAIAAGADFPAWLIQELRGVDPQIAFDGWQDGLCMFRYDWAVFVPHAPGTSPSGARNQHRLPTFE